MKTTQDNQTQIKTPNILIHFWIIIVGVLLTAGPLWSQPTQKDYEPGIVLVKFNNQSLPNISSRISGNDINIPAGLELLNKAGFTRGKRMFEHFFPSDTLSVSLTGEPVKLVDLSRWYRLRVAPGADLVELSEKLEALPGILSATPDYYLELDDTYPNDTNFGSQWGLYNSSNPGNDIHAPQAWDLNQGRSDVVIGVIDSGIDYNHNDLDPGDRSRVIQGYDFANNDSDPMDDAPGGNHGTPVAGAITDNNQQVAGVMWNTKLMPLKIKESSETGNDVSISAAANAVDYARQNGADILNMSFSRPDCSTVSCSFIGNPLGEPLLNAWNSNLLLVASSGNDGQEEAIYPASWHMVMAVGASDDGDGRASFSNYGSYLDVVAPGDDIYSTSRNNNVGSFDGTSFATPMVVGIGGLILSESRDLGLNLTNDDIRHLIQATADKVQGMQGQNFHNEYGYGRANAYEALELINPPNIVEHGTHTGGNSTLNWDSHSHEFHNNGGGLASGDYYGVKQYKVTGHVSFSHYYENPPEVWIRERSTKGWNAANPNQETPWVQITNVSNSGFDFQTFVYYIGYNSAGQSIDAYYPASPAQAEIAWTAVGKAFPEIGSHTFSSGTTLSNALYYGTTTINSGVTLTIPAGNEVHFSDVVNGASGAHIKVYGTMVMEPDTDINDVQLTVYDGGKLEVENGDFSFQSDQNLIVQSGGNLELDGANFTKSGSSAWPGLEIMGLAEMEDVTIEYADIGLYVSGSGADGSYLRDGWITNSTDHGVYGSSALFDLEQVRIEDSGLDGIHMEPWGVVNNFLYSAPDYYQLSNRVEDSGRHGLASKYGGVILFSEPGSGDAGGNNAVFGSGGYHIYAYVSGQVTAEETWWGQYTPDPADFYSYGGAQIDYSDHLTSDPWGPPYQAPSSTLADGDAPGGDNGELKSERPFWVRMVQRRKTDRAAMKTELKTIAENPEHKHYMQARQLLIQEYAHERQWDRAVTLAEDIFSDTEQTATDRIMAGIQLVNLGIANRKLKIDHSSTISELERLGYDPEDAEVLSKLADRRKTGEPEMAAGEPDDEGQPATLAADSYPNPFNPAATIQFTLPRAENVTLQVYNILGRRVATLVDGRLEAGSHNVQFNGANLSSGVYLYRLETPQKVLTGRMTLIK